MLAFVHVFDQITRMLHANHMVTISHILSTHFTTGDLEMWDSGSCISFCYKHQQKWSNVHSAVVIK
jgi:hypothetical protein